MKILLVSDKIIKNLEKIGYYIVKNGQNCSHKNCCIHITHCCERCGRIGANGDVILNILDDNNYYHHPI
jgi:hypothetical protein